jgi:hypothetical protein
MHTLPTHDALMSEQERLELIMEYAPSIVQGIYDLQYLCHQLARGAGWYTDPKTGEPKQMNAGERFMLMVTELAEGYEGHRVNKMDDKLPYRKSEEVELADAIIRECDYAGANNHDLARAILEKLVFNITRPDHKLAARAQEGGKRA